VNDLAARVGVVERSSALKALFAWVDRGVLREETNNADEQCFRLLELVPEDSGAASGMTAAGSRPVLAEEEPAMLTVQQQQAEQMKVFWKVRHLCWEGARTRYN
jgi:anaphase-promoting complex subunit 2